MRGVHMPGGGPSVHIEKAENGYMVSLIQGGDPMMGGIGMPFDRTPEPHMMEELKKEADKYRPRIFVYSEIEEAWNAIKEFLLDGRMPKSAR